MLVKLVTQDGDPVVINPDHIVLMEFNRFMNDTRIVFSLGDKSPREVIVRGTVEENAEALNRHYSSPVRFVSFVDVEGTAWDVNPEDISNVRKTGKICVVELSTGAYALVTNETCADVLTSLDV